MLKLLQKVARKILKQELVLLESDHERKLREESYKNYEYRGRYLELRETMHAEFMETSKIIQKSWDDEESRLKMEVQKLSSERDDLIQYRTAFSDLSTALMKNLTTPISFQVVSCVKTYDTQWYQCEFLNICLVNGTLETIFVQRRAGTSLSSFEKEARQCASVQELRALDEHDSIYFD